MASTSHIQILLEILHREENSRCMECPEDTWPCRTMRLLKVGAELDGMKVDLRGPIRALGIV